MKRFPSVSVIIPTLNRKDVLKEALLSLNGVNYPRDRFEVVVVSDGSTDGTEKMVKKIKKKFNYRFVFIKQRRKGISHAKNVAIKNSKGKIIISTDDDCLFEKNWLRKLIKPFADPQVGAVGGPDRPVKNQGLIAKSIDFAFNSFFGSGGIHGRFIKVKLGKFYPIGCNTAFAKKALKKAGLFDENLAPGEDTDLDHRIENAGFKLAYVSEAFVWHRPKSDIRAFFPYVYKRGAARVEILRRHFQYAEFIYFLPAIMILIAFLLLSLSLYSLVFLKIFIFLFALYILLLFIAGIFAFLAYGELPYLFLVPVLIFFQHLMHGVGFIIGFLKLIGQRLLVKVKK